MKTILLLSVAMSSSFANAEGIQSGYCLVKQSQSTEMLSYFSSRNGDPEYFTFQGTRAQVTQGSFKDGSFQGRSDSPGRPSCRLTTYVEFQKSISATEFIVAIRKVDRCRRFVFEIPVTEEARCVALR